MMDAIPRKSDLSNGGQMIRSANQYVYDSEIFHWTHNRCPFLVEDLVYQGSWRLAAYDASPGDLESAQRIE